MDAFDRFLTDCVSDSVNARGVTGANIYRRQADGFYSNGLPCPTCGSISVMLNETPECATCGPRVEQMRVDIEKLSRRLDALNEVAHLLPPAARRELRHQAEFWLVHMSKLVLAVADDV